MKISEAMLKELIVRWDNEALFEANKSKSETLRMCADTIRMLLDLPEALQPFENPEDYEPCPVCNPSGTWKYSPEKDCVCNGIAYVKKTSDKGE